jgi:glycosyltransferase involved in cell wall biosynthesis
MTRRSVLVIAFSPLHEDARVQRQISCLGRDHDVTVVAYGSLPAELSAHARLLALPPPRGSVRRHGFGLALLGAGRLTPERVYRRWYWNRDEYRATIARTRELRPDIVVANDWTALPVALEIAARSGARVLADMHEYAPSQRVNRGYWRLLYAPMITFMIRDHLPRVDAAITVSKMIAERYEREFGVAMDVIMNASDVERFPEARPVEQDRIRLVHHGVCIPERHIETMVDAAAALGRPFELDLMLVERDRAYMRRMRRRAERAGCDNVRFRAPVPPSRIVDTIAEYDIGVCVHRPITFNLQAVLPNKFFDYVAAGLAVCTGPSPEITRLAREGGFGIIADGFGVDDLRRALAALTPAQIGALKRAAVGARGALTARTQMASFRRIVETL